MKSSRSENILYYLANRYLRPFLPEKYLTELQFRFQEAETYIKENPETLSWSQHVLWLSHWDGVLSSNMKQTAISSTISTALLEDKKVIVQYEGKDKPFQFNVFGLIKRDQNLLMVGTCNEDKEPIVLTIRKVASIELTEESALQPIAEFDLQTFLNKQLNFSFSKEKLSLLQIEFSKDLYSYVKDNPLDAEHIKLTTPDEYHHAGYFLLEVQGVMDGERLRQWIRGFSDKAQVLKPIDLRLVMEQARLDTRTNLLTATEFSRCLKREIQRCFRNKPLAFALLILDLDHFKLVNDLNGHDFGDKVLLQVADCIREYDEAARHGGEEFSVLLPNVNAEEAIVIAERIRHQIEQQKMINLKGRVIPVTTSIGVAVYPDDLSPKIKKQLDQDKVDAVLSDVVAADIFHQADQALYQAKEQGRNQVFLAANR